MNGCDSHIHLSLHKGIKKCVSLQDGIDKHITVCGDYVPALLPDSPENFLVSNEALNPFSISNDGVDGVIRVPASPTIDFQDNFTFECDIRRSVLGVVDRIFWQRETTPVNTGGFFGFHSDNTVRLTFFTVADVIFTTKIEDTNWHHIAITVSDTSLVTLYIDKVAVETSQLPSSPVASGSDLGITCVITDNTIGGSYSLDIDNIRVWHTERTASQIADNADVILGGNETNLQAYWKCDENGTPENTVVDSAGNNDGITSGGITYQQDVRFGSDNVTTFNWDAVSGVNGYNVYLSVDGGAFVKHNGALITELEYSIEALAAGDYQAYVTSENDDGESDPSNIVDFTVV